MLPSLVIETPVNQWQCHKNNGYIPLVT